MTIALAAATALALVVPAPGIPMQATNARLWDLTEALRHTAAMPRVDDGKDDHWRPATQKHGGDCEDFALAARRFLVDRGWPAGALRIATAWDEKNEFHAVLTVDLERAGSTVTYVIDSRFPQVETYASLMSIGYRWDRREQPAGFMWSWIASPKPNGSSQRMISQ